MVALRTFKSLVAGVIALLLLSALATPVAAQDEPPPQPPEPRCDVDQFNQIRLIDPGVGFPAYDGVAVGESPVHTLAESVSGRVLVSGIVSDSVHLEDVPDGSTDLSQFAEQLSVRFLAADGTVVGESLPTPDIPDIAPAMPFALPSVDLTGEASAIQLIHAGDASSPNSIVAECINVTAVALDAYPYERLTPSICPLDAALTPAAVCGFLAVPEERSDPGSRWIQIAVAIEPGPNMDGRVPVVYLEGGPGGAPIAAAGLIAGAGMNAAVDGRTVIYVDQRGTGYSNPNLTCTQPSDLAGPPADELPPEMEEIAEEIIEEGEVPPEMEELTPEEIELIQEFIRQEMLNALAQCADRLTADGTNLAGFTTVENAADLDELRLALGLEQWNLYGGSYGTDLALTMMRDAPAGIRTSILDSVFPPVVSVPLDDRVGMLNSLSRVADRCGSQLACDAAFPDLQGDIIQAHRYLVEEPIFFPEDELAASFLLGGFPLESPLFLRIVEIEQAYELTPAFIAGMADSDPAVRQAAATTFVRAVSAREIINLLEQLAGLPEGDVPPDEPSEMTPEDIEALKSAGIASPWAPEFDLGVPGIANFFSDGFFLSVICAEERPYQEAVTEAVDVWTDEIVADVELIWPENFECDVWPTVAEDPVVAQPVVSDVPSLVLATDTDFQTPPAWSELTADTLSNSHYFEFPHLAHVVVLQGNPCPVTVMSTFLDDPANPDGSCIADMPVVQYVPALPDLAPIDDLVAEIESILGPPPA